MAVGEIMEILGLCLAVAFCVAERILCGGGIRASKGTRYPAAADGVKGHRRAKMARHLLANLDAYLSACQLGITIASLALGL